MRIRENVLFDLQRLILRGEFNAFDEDLQPVQLDSLIGRLLFQKTLAPKFSLRPTIQGGSRFDQITDTANGFGGNDLHLFREAGKFLRE